MWRARPLPLDGVPLLRAQKSHQKGPPGRKSFRPQAASFFRIPVLPEKTRPSCARKSATIEEGVRLLVRTRGRGGRPRNRPRRTPFDLVDARGPQLCQDGRDVWPRRRPMKETQS
jgi:hypothetical protein